MLFKGTLVVVVLCAVGEGCCTSANVDLDDQPAVSVSDFLKYSTSSQKCTLSRVQRVLPSRRSVHGALKVADCARPVAVSFVFQVRT